MFSVGVLEKQGRAHEMGSDLDLTLFISLGINPGFIGY